MTNPTPHEVTQLLAEWSGGDESALAALLPLVEKEWKQLAVDSMDSQSCQESANDS